MLLTTVYKEGAPCSVGGVTFTKFNDEWCSATVPPHNVKYLGLTQNITLDKPEAKKRARRTQAEIAADKAKAEAEEFAVLEAEEAAKLAESTEAAAVVIVPEQDSGE